MDYHCEEVDFHRYYSASSSKEKDSTGDDH